MFDGKRVLAVVPARSGSKGVPDKNIRLLGGKTLISWAGNCLKELNWLDGKILTTDSAHYAEEGKRCGLDSPFLRPPELSNDHANAIDTVIHALSKAEELYQCIFDIVLIIEPTSPCRRPVDLEETVRLLVEQSADSVVCVSPLNTKSHPAKALRMTNRFLEHYEKRGAEVTARQQLELLYSRNGICYTLTRDCLLKKKAIFTKKTMPYVIDRQIVNIDEPIDFEWAEFLLARGLF